MKHTFVACDCGNSSVRVLLCTETEGRISLETILQEPNGMIHVGGYDYWDMLRVFEHLKEGIRLATQREKIDSIGVCTWGVDFALFDESGFMLGNPLSYRNTIGGQQMDRFSESELREMFFRTGILSDRINSVFMLAGMWEKMPGLVAAGWTFLMVPDILHYFFTGVMQREPSEFSTTQLMDVRTIEICPEQVAMASVSLHLFPPPAEHGKLIGMLSADVKAELGLNYDIPVVCVPSHDTASAVLGTPAPEDDFAFVSAGTWALVGLHRPKPMISQEIFEAGFTNEVGPFGRTTLLKNSIGLFLMQRLRREFGAVLGRTPAWQELDEESSKYDDEPLLVNVNHRDFFNPENMSETVWAHLVKVGQTSGLLQWPAVLSAVKTSLAVSWVDAFEQIFQVVGKRYDKLYIVGGGARDAEICQCCANVSGMEIVVCGEECACVGNAVAQLAFARPEFSYKDLRAVAANSLHVQTYRRETDQSALLGRYRSLFNYKRKPNKIG